MKKAFFTLAISILATTANGQSSQSASNSNCTQQNAMQNSQTNRPRLQGELAMLSLNKAENGHQTETTSADCPEPNDGILQPLKSHPVWKRL